MPRPAPLLLFAALLGSCADPAATPVRTLPPPPDAVRVADAPRPHAAEVATGPLACAPDPRILACRRGVFDGPGRTSLALGTSATAIALASRASGPTAYVTRYSADLTPLGETQHQASSDLVAVAIAALPG